MSWKNGISLYHSLSPRPNRLSTPSLIAAKAWAKASDIRPKSRPLAPCPRIRRPSPSATGAMNGNVSGLPTTVPISAAIMLARIARATASAKTKCSPKNGVNELKTPQATPSAIRCGVSGSRRTRCPRYSKPAASRAAGAPPRGFG